MTQHLTTSALYPAPRHAPGPGTFAPWAWLLWLALGLQGTAHAAGPSPTRMETPAGSVFAMPVLRSLGDVLQNPVDEQRVVLRGYLRENLGRDRYLFVANPHRIRVEIEPEVQPTAPVTPQTLVEIEGEVDKDFLRPLEIEVRRVTVVDVP